MARTNDSPVISWTSTTTMNFTCSLDSERYEPCGSGRSGQWTRDNVPDGGHVFRVKGQDNMGNTVGPETFSWTVGMVLL